MKITAMVGASLLILGSAPFVASSASAQISQPVRPLQANLVGPLDISRIKVGQNVLARVIQEWDGGTCHLVVNSIVEGHVVQIIRRSKTDKTTAMHLVFDKANCDNQGLANQPLRLIALIGPLELHPTPGGESGVSEGPPLSDLPLTIGGGLRSTETAATVDQYALAGGISRKLPKQILPGQVIDLPRMNLAVGTGVDGASIVWSSQKEARLEPLTTLILLPAPASAAPVNAGVTPASPGGSINEVAANTTRPASPVARAIGAADAADETEICSGACNAVGSTALRDADTTAISASLPIAQLGFHPHEKRLALSFDRETAITYLDEHHLLCTFDPHGLRERIKDDADGVHTIRAILIDPSTRTITRVLEWRVRGNGAYLWRLGEGRVLVHLGNQLRLLDAQLNPLKAIPVSGSIAWVVSSPSRDHVAVAILKKRDNPIPQEEKDAIHLPDADLDVRVYDGSLNLLSGAIRPRQSLPPVLSDGGELRLAKVSTGRWKIMEFAWDKSERTLATVRTACRPLASSPEHGLIFVTGCMNTTGGTWYRMLREDGHPLLKAESPTDEIDQTAEGALTGSFAVRVLKTSKPMTVDQPYERNDLTREEIAIYRSSDGARVTSVVTKDFILAQNSYALSPTGDQMAIVGKDSILFYNVKLHP